MMAFTLNVYYGIDHLDSATALPSALGRRAERQSFVSSSQQNKSSVSNRCAFPSQDQVMQIGQNLPNGYPLGLGFQKSLHASKPPFHFILEVHFHRCPMARSALITKFYYKIHSVRLLRKPLNLGLHNLTGAILNRMMASCSMFTVDQ